ncbi:hypothetical protein [Tabrizicola sp.]|uniref:hypothetical protein n=1 Tax=Tabrizicola sp. TaxID=2005166 RepID=UPI0027344FD1|nr:hypothetical protein [Tabrizicola sp.]MDP3197319.1 hypothetical protein [Tabrizicola sp.]
MTRRKDPQPEAVPPQDTPPVETVANEPFVVTDPVDPAPAPPDAPLPPPPSQVIVRRSSVIAPLIGGALAAIGGFALSHFDVLDLRPADSTAEVAGLTTQLTDVRTQISGLESQSHDLAALSQRVAQLETAPAPQTPDLSRLDAFDQRLAAIEAMPTDGAASTAAVTAKLAELERRLAAVPQGASAELQQQLDAALARLDEAEATATARAEEAAVATAAAQRTQALDALAARLSAGEAFGAELQALDDPAVSQVLAPLAETGIPTLAQLQDAFPDAAREALRIARETGAKDGWGGRLVDFLASQTGARPLTPMEGDTPDAILSRADFALTDGRVADAVAELQPLDPTVKAALDPWLAQAQAHLLAAAALQSARGE